MAKNATSPESIDDILDSVEEQGFDAPAVVKDARKGGRPVVPIPEKGEERRLEMQRQAKRNPLVKHVEKGQSASLDMIDAIMHQLTTEIAYLEFAQRERIVQGKDPAELSTKKISALKGLAEIWFKKRDQVLDEMFDLKSARMQAVFEYFMQTIAQACEDAGMGDEMIEVFFSKLGGRLEGWEDEAATVARNVEASGEPTTKRKRRRGRKS